MRKRIVAGNWKMNLEMESAVSLATDVCQGLEALGGRPGNHLPEVVFFPPAPFVPAVVQVTASRPGIHVGAQDLSAHEQGAYTGEVSAKMIRSAGATHVLIGHSERRAYHGESHELLLAKLRQALAHQLVPVYCCGEGLPEREAGRHFAVVGDQLEQVVYALQPREFSRLLVAYEPVWAIGTGVTASPAQAQEMHTFIREQIAGRFGNELADNLSILYGGSCNPGNASALFSNPDVDGGLIGGASLKAADFVEIIQAI